MIKLTEHERNVLAHALMTENVADTPDRMVERSIVDVGEEKTRQRIDAKVAKYEQNYQDCLAAEGAIVLSEEERDVLDHVLIVETPEHWVARNVAAAGARKTRQRLDAKVARHKESHDQARAEEGTFYRDAKWHRAYDTAHQEVQVQEELTKLRQRQADLHASIRDEILAELAPLIGNAAPQSRA
jgi:shikimate kinase